MALPSRIQFLALDWYWRGQPFCKLPVIPESLLSMDWYWQGQPFVTVTQDAPITIDATRDEVSAAADASSAALNTVAVTEEAGPAIDTADVSRAIAVDEAEVLIAQDSPVAWVSTRGVTINWSYPTPPTPPAPPPDPYPVRVHPHYEE